MSSLVSNIFFDFLAEAAAAVNGSETKAGLSTGALNYILTVLNFDWERDFDKVRWVTFRFGVDFLTAGIVLREEFNNDEDRLRDLEKKIGKRLIWVTVLVKFVNDLSIIWGFKIGFFW